MRLSDAVVELKRFLNTHPYLMTGVNDSPAVIWLPLLLLCLIHGRHRRSLCSHRLVLLIFFYLGCRRCSRRLLLLLYLIFLLFLLL